MENLETRRILRQRAEMLARPLATLTASDATAIEFVEFSLAHEHYAVENHWVEEVCPFKELTPLPGVPPFISGIVNIRGRILAVVNLKKFFGLPEKGITDLHRIILIRSEDLEFGLLADAVTGVRTFPAGDIQPAPATLDGIRGDYLRGVTSNRVAILNMARIVSDPKLIVHDETNN